MDNFIRDPCPWRIIYDTGAAFTVGTIGGSLFESIRGFRNSPAGLPNRMIGSWGAIQARAPFHGGMFAAWGGLFTVVECSIVKIRRKEDSWNYIMSGFVTGGIVAARRGPKSMWGNAVLCGTVMAMIEGLMILQSRWTAATFRPIGLMEVIENVKRLSNPIYNPPPPLSTSFDQDQQEFRNKSI